MRMRGLFSLNLPSKTLFLAVTVLLSRMSLPAQTVIWSGADALSGVNTNWSDSTNWTGGAPGPATNIFLINSGANSAQGVVNNIVNNNTTISSLNYGNTNGFHTTQINAGVTLAVSNTAAATLVFVGTGSDNGANQILYTTMTGPGAFTATGSNSGSIFSIQQGSTSSGSHMATLDMSALANFKLTIGRLLIGGNGGSSGNVNRPSGTIYLAGTNTIRVNGSAPAIDIGDGPSNSGTENVYLGRTNAIFADTMTVARQKCTATMAFNPAFGAGATFSLNGNTNSRVSVLAIGDFSAQSGSGSVTFGTMDLVGGTVNVQVDTCYVAEGQTGGGGGPTTGVLDIGAGVFDVNTLNVGYV